MYPNKLNVKVGTNKYILKIYINKKNKKMNDEIITILKKTNFNSSNVHRVLFWLCVFLTCFGSFACELW